MADTINHFRLVIEGDYDPARTALAEEQWAFGVSLYAQLSAIPSVGTPDGSFEAASQLLSDEDVNWTVSSNFLAEGGVNDINPVDLLLDTLGPAVATFFPASAVCSSTAKARKLSLYPLKPWPSSGTATHFRACTTDYGPAKAELLPKNGTFASGQTTGNPLPVQDAVVVSLKTANTSPRGRGRFYLPTPGVAGIGADGQLSTAWRDNIGAAAKAFLEALDFTSGVAPDWAMSPVVIGAPGTTFYRVQRVKVGSQVDTQRRRRRRVGESFYDAALTLA